MFWLLYTKNMKYIININQIKCIEYWLNLQQWAILDLIWYSSVWAEEKNINWKIYYYLSAWKILDEYPIISKNKNTILKIIKIILQKWLIEREILNNKSYYKLTQKWKEFFIGVEKNQEGCGKKSTLGVEKNQHYNITSNNITNNKIIKEKNIKKEKIKKEKSLFIKSSKDIFELLNNENILDKYEIDKNELEEEVKKFIDYWTEENSRWKKRYEFEKTFDPNRRFARWLSNNKKWNKKNLNNKPNWIWIIE